MVILAYPAGNTFPWYGLRVSLSGVIYTINLRYNTRMHRWIMDINDASNNPIQVGLPILIDRNVAGQYVTAGLPPGTTFSVCETANPLTQPSRLSFGTTHTLYYADPTQ